MAPQQLESLISTDELKTTKIEKLLRSEKLRPSISYEDDFDALTILLVQSTKRSVHYIDDDHVALLYDPDTMDIVGIQIEDFEHSYLPGHDELAKVWRLSDSDERIKDVGDVMIVFQRKESELAREVFKATENPLTRERPGLGNQLRDFLHA